MFGHNVCIYIFHLGKLSIKKNNTGQQYKCSVENVISKYFYLAFFFPCALMSEFPCPSS